MESSLQTKVFLKPFLASHNRVCFVHSCPAPEASLYFQWLQWIFKVIGTSLHYFVINVDETSMQNEYLVKKGYVVQMSAKDRAEANCFFQKIDPSSTRSHSTLVGVITANPGAQSWLPQIFIPNKDRITQREMGLYKEHLHSPIEVWDDLTGWVTQDVMIAMVTRYRQVVRQHHPDKQLVIILDAASQHVSKRVLMHARRLNVILVMIPGKLTWLLQPLDVSVFRVLKDRFKKALMTKKMLHPEGIVTTTDRMDALNESVHSTLVNTEWGPAFGKVGALGDFSELRQTLKVYFPSGVNVPQEALTDEQMEEVASRRRVDLACQFNSCPERLFANSQQMDAIEDGPSQPMDEEISPVEKRPMEESQSSFEGIQTRSKRRCFKSKP